MFPLKGNKIAGVIGVIIAILISYFVLFGPEQTVLSVSRWVAYSIRPHSEIFIVFLIPLYMSGMIFGSSFIGWLSGRKIYKILHHH